MKKITITSTVYCEQTQDFYLTEEQYNKYILKINLLDFEINQEELIDLYNELEEEVDQIDDVMIAQLDSPEVINNIDF